MNTDLILKNIQHLIKIDPEEMDFFISLLRLNTIKRNQFLLREGEVSTEIFFVNSGCLRVYNIDEKGEPHVAHFAIADHWVSDLYSFLTETPATFNIDALEDTELLSISKSDIERLYRKVPKFERFFRIRHQRAFVNLMQRTMHSISKPTEEKYLKFRKQYPGLELRISQKHIAAYLGITPEYLSMIRSKMTDRNS